jgi:hypothetical protein
MNIELLIILGILMIAFMGLITGMLTGLVFAYLAHLIIPSYPFNYSPMIGFGIGFGLYGLITSIKRFYF